ncbi:CoA transferase [Ramlibacter sp. G-1-2-2]|uniref:CoA transferase n=1 Tax=Ramlibacter agri TaxID=2728837 RepID=A0A848HF42_9BURK|nr:CoA transferase [Ramlibacter agri]NML46218.1 CoA transferase [Ramlibacter agri]
MSTPLRGVRVIDLSRLVAGNMLTMQLADFGADVLKIEDPEGGDTLRHWKEPLDGGRSLDAWWQVYGRNKRSAALDLRDAQARELLKKLVAGADVLVESFRPGRLESLGLGPADLHAVAPRLVIVRISGWGQSGPYSELPGFGSLVEGFSGFAHKHSESGAPRLPNMALADMVAGLSGAFATLAAVREVEVNGGRGQVVDLSLLEPMLSILGPDAAILAATGRAPDPTIKVASPRGVYRCRDGAWVALSGSTETMARRVMEAIGRPELCADPRFASNAARLANDAELDGCIADFIAGLGLAECLALFRERGVTVGPVHDTASLLADRHVQQRGCFVPFGPRHMVMHAVTPRLDGTPGALRNEAPLLGEHTAQVLQELGVAAGDIQALAERGTVRCA